jgi:soluble lytic murein transglycosylase
MMKRFFVSLVLCSGMLLLSTASHAADFYEQAFQAADAKQWGEAQQAANQSGQKLLQDYIAWRKFKAGETRADASELLQFVEQHPDWPDVKLLLDYAEESLLLQGVSWQQAARWQRLHEDITEKKLRDAAHKDPVRYLIHHAWVNGNFNPAEQDQILRSYSGQLGQKEIAKRVDTLLWNEQANKVRPLLSRLAPMEHKLATARLALQSNQFKVENLIAALPAEIRNHPAILYERMRWRARKQLESGVKEILLAAPARVPHPEKWWSYRVRLVRQALEDNNRAEALQLLQNHAQTSGAELADALWLKGWLTLRDTKDAATAYKEFYALYHHVSFPVSLSRGAYWAGIAAKANGNDDIAANWFLEASKHPTTFYGQLALLELPHPTALTLPLAHTASPNFSASQRSLIALIKILARYQQQASVEKFITALAMQEKNAANLAAIGKLGEELVSAHLAVRVGKIAAQQAHQWLGKVSHPLPALGNLAVEPALTLAITRQESEFNPRARSVANAMGLMQLLPSTAKSVANRWGIPYSEAVLYNPQTNMQLGSAYLLEMIDKWGGSYPLAIASYNAGAGNVNKWIAQFGRPPADLTGQLHWLEQIPFSETRNYVQRVLENLQVYRAMLGDKRPLTAQRMVGK